MRCLTKRLTDMTKIIDFAQTYLLYRKGGHGIAYSARIAWGCVVQGLPF